MKQLQCIEHNGFSDQKEITMLALLQVNLNPFFNQWMRMIEIRQKPMQVGWKMFGNITEIIEVADKTENLNIS